jgi:hypothetical protein
MKKHWIYIKRGLSEDPKHRAKMGECIWLFMHIVDRADFETGIAYDWKDGQEAADMCMPVPTLRMQRRKLAESGYITVNQKQHSLDIVIHEWVDPRSYSSPVINRKFQGFSQGDDEPSLSEIREEVQGDSQGDGQGYIQDDSQGSVQPITPTYSSSSSSSSNPLSTAGKIAGVPSSEEKRKARAQGNPTNGIQRMSDLEDRFSNKDAAIKAAYTYPLDCQKMLFWLIEAFNWKDIPVEANSTNGRGEFALWIKELRTLTHYAGRFGKDAFDAALRTWNENGFVATHPGALVSTMFSEASILNTEEAKRTNLPVDLVIQ